MDRIAEILKSKFGITAPYEEYPGWRWKGPCKVEQVCNKCGASDDIWCLYADAGAVDYYDEFYHICLSCGHIAHESNFGGFIGYEGHAYCPFCSYQWE